MKKSKIFEIEPEDIGCSKEFCQLINNSNIRLEEVEFSSVVMNDKIKHFILAIWHDFEYGEENY